MQLIMRWKDTRITELTAIHEFGKVHACARMISGERRGQDRRMTAIGFADNPAVAYLFLVRSHDVSQRQWTNRSSDARFQSGEDNRGNCHHTYELRTTGASLQPS